MRNERSNALDDVIDVDDEKKSRRDDKPKAKSHQLFTPVQCTLCMVDLRCPESQDMDVFMENSNKKCLTSNNPTCVKAVNAKWNQTFVNRLRISHG